MNTDTARNAGFTSEAPAIEATSAAEALALVRQHNSGPTVDLTGYTDDEHLLHFDGERMDPVVERVWQTLRLAAIEVNPDLDPGEAAQRLLCGGCLQTFMGLLHERILDEAKAEEHEAYRWFKRAASILGERSLWHTALRGVRNSLRGLRDERLG